MGHGALHIPYIVESIKNPEHIYAIFMGCFDEFINNIIRVMAVTNKILPSEEHLDGSIPEFCLEGPKPIPGIII
jgi:hypothetical protein